MHLKRDPICTTYFTKQEGKVFKQTYLKALVEKKVFYFLYRPTFINNTLLIDFMK